MLIAVGRSRKDTRWHNTEYTWETFLEKLRESHTAATRQPASTVP